MLLAYWHRCLLVKILSKIYQVVQRNVSTNTMSWCTHCWFGNNLCWHPNGSNLTEALFAGMVPDTPNVCQIDRAWRLKCLSSPRPQSLTCFCGIEKSWRPVTEKDHQLFMISQGNSARFGGILYLGKSGSSEKSNEKYGCKLMVIRAAAGMRARTRSENLAEAEHANRLVKEILIILKCNF